MTTEEKVAYNKPIPVMRSPLVREFYAWIHKHELRFQKCTSCGTWRHTPRELCGECGSSEFEWVKSSGKGKVFTWTTPYQALHPAFVQDVPYAGVIVELAEGPRMVSLVDCPVDELKMDMPVEVYFDDVTPEFTFAKFRPAR